MGAVFALQRVSIKIIGLFLRNVRIVISVIIGVHAFEGVRVIKIVGKAFHSQVVGS